MEMTLRRKLVIQAYDGAHAQEPHTNAANGGDQLIFYLNTCKEELLPFPAPHFPKEETNQSQSTIIQESSASQLFF